jgi:ankyrin repeat protein
MLFFPCENLEPEVLKVLLDHGANPDCAPSPRREAGTALDYACRTYVRRQHDLTVCIDLLLAAGGTTQFDVPVIMDLLRNRLDSFAERLAAEPSLVSARFPQLTFGNTGGRLLQLRGATLLHVAAEYQNLAAATLLIDRGADVNARATVDDNGVGGQTPLFHSATQFSDNGLLVTRLLVARGADLSARAKVPGHYEREGEVVDCTALGYALHLEEVTRKPKTIAFLRDRGAPE